MNTKVPEVRGDDRRQRIIASLRVDPGSAADLAGRDTRWTGGGEFDRLSATELDAAARAVLAAGVEQLADAQELLWASDSYALLVVFQAMDAAGKDSTIKHVMSGVNPQGVQVVSFKKPSSDELDHTFLWRIGKAVPERGRIGIFNRSHYEEVVALRVHPEWLDHQRLPQGDRGPSFWADRHDDLNSFEQHLDRNGTKVVKFFLHVSKAEQKRRFMARLDNHGHLHTVGAVVRDPRRSQTRYAGNGGRHHRRHHPSARPAMADCLSRRESRQRRVAARVGSRVRHDR